MKPAGLLLFLVSFATSSPGAGPENQIDELIDRKLAEQTVPPNEIVDDATFLRRVSLDLVGRIPTLAEIEQYESQPAESRRHWIVDELLNHNPEGYTSHFYHFWADLLRINKRLGTNETPDDVEYAYRFWIKQALYQNLPYDEFVQQLITAEGHSWENGALGYYQRDRGMPLDNLSNTIRVFLGTRLECAQCHDHPFDVWTQMDYYKMAAFSYGMASKGHTNANREALQVHLEKTGEKAFRAASGLRADSIPVFRKAADLKSWMTKQRSAGAWPQILKSSGLSEPEFTEAAKRGIDALKTHNRSAQQLQNAENSLFVRVRYVTTRGVERTLQLPHDYQYKDAAPFDPVEASTMFGPEVSLSDTAHPTDRIRAYAEWMTSPENPTFTRVIVNRLWKQIFGAALFEPVDEITESTTISNPELLTYL
ncbi:MAG: DUF1549 domain-containing protein, partial [Verrucomicrobiales bacterium]|nr:DUF1549 domain-containing protein [Verrucomicrobiales bacterium]